MTIDTAGTLRVTGWAGDRNASAVLRVVLRVDGRWVPRAYGTDKARPDVARRYGRDAKVGFDVSLRDHTGTPTVCVVVIKEGSPVRSVLGCRTAEKVSAPRPKPSKPAKPSPTPTPTPAPTPTPTPTPPPDGFVWVDAGRSHTCGVTGAGGVRCWGYNDDWQLGDGTHTPRSTPTDVVGLSSGVKQVSAGEYHTCAVTTAGALKCWGYNGQGRLGDGTQTSRSTPTDVVGLSSGVKQVSAGGTATCAVTTAGALKCWGYNNEGTVGDGTNTDRWAPVDVVGLGTGVKQVSVGNYHVCAVTTAGALKCWGYNDEGMLGNGTDVTSWTPVDVTGLGSGVSQVSASSDHTCAATTDGAAKCWGGNWYGQLGDGTEVDSWTPVDVVGLGSGVSKVRAGRSHTCAVTTDGAAKCWGYNWNGQLGDGTDVDSLTPVDVVGLGTGVSQVTAGESYTCAVTTTWTAKCWGYNGEGQLGDGTDTSRATPTDVLT